MQVLTGLEARARPTSRLRMSRWEQEAARSRGEIQSLEGLVGGRCEVNNRASGHLESREPLQMPVSFSLEISLNTMFRFFSSLIT